MQCDLLPFEIDYLSGGGLTLSSRERAMLSTSMAALKRSSNLKNVYFWGKILGQDKDFYIAYGFNTDLLENRQYYRRYGDGGDDGMILQRGCHQMGGVARDYSSTCCTDVDSACG